MDKKTLGDKIVYLREQKGWSQNKLAKLAKVSQSVLSDIEKSPKIDPRLSTLRKIAKALNIPVEDLVREDHPKIKCPPHLAG